MNDSQRSNSGTRSNARARRGRLLDHVMTVGAVGVAAFITIGALGAFVPPAPNNYVVFAWNDLGMHCMNEDFSEMMILPPYNTVRAQVIDRTHGSPEIVTEGVTVHYRIPSNTHSFDKTNFWQYADELFGVALQPDVGLTGNGLSGTMVRAAGARDYIASGIPITPVDDSGREDPYPLATVSVEVGGQVVAVTQTVVPVSWEISCNICHTTPGITVATDILRKHDVLHGTQLESQKPVNCSSCHADPALGAPGQPGIPNMSSAMHASHAARMGPAANLVSECYACHPGVRTNCQRDVHTSRGLSCISCHGGMAEVGDPARTPWVTEPRCADCHQAMRPSFEFEPPGVLFRDATGHGGVKCITCHGSPHTMGPATTDTDNLQATRLQGHAGVISTCTTCHSSTPSDPFPHRRDDD